MVTLAGLIVDVPHTDVSQNVFVTALSAEPPGPFAATRASYVTPTCRGVVSSDRYATRMKPSVSGAGLPRLAVYVTVPEPATWMFNV